MKRVFFLRSLRYKLALVIFAITAAAFGALYFLVVPQLESNLEQQRLTDLQDTAREARSRFEDIVGEDVGERLINSRVRAAADDTDARVTLLGLRQGQTAAAEPRFFTVSDSREQTDVPIVAPNRSLERRAVDRSRAQSAIAVLDGEDVAQVAQSIKFHREPAWVVLYTRELDDVAEAVTFVRNRMLLATGAALILALAGGYLVARRLSRRVDRLEEAAKEVASGRFRDPLPVDSEDELGQLTRTFNEMQERLRQLDVARKDFIATASHELRTPIFSLAGFVELLQDEDLDDETRHEFIETMSEQVARLQKLSVDLLDLSRLDAGSLQLETGSVDLAELAQSVVGEFVPALSERGTELEVDLPEGSVAARCDRERVAQIVRILVDNALRHTPDGTHVTITATRLNGVAEVTVADSGPGMGESVQANAFERFYTGDATRGAGLGLAIARELAERMSGHLRLASRPGDTEFTLELPVDDREAVRP